MKILFLIAVVLGQILYSIADQTEYVPPSENQIKEQWELFKVENNFYSGERYDRFKQEYLKSQFHNYKFSLKNETYTTKVTPFSLMELNETQSVLTFGLKAPVFHRNYTRHLYVISRATIPDSVDWRYTFANPPKYQASCGACWAFTSAGVVESLYYIKQEVHKEYSIQQLLDCTLHTRSIASNMKNYGCKGGWPDNGFEYIKQYGITEAHRYQYSAKEETCRENFPDKIKIRGYGDVPYANEQQLKRAVYFYGPVAVGIDASKWGFSNYKSGVYTDKKCSKTNLNHAVIVVGYGSENGEDYWLVRNSWGTDWGLNGYIKMARNKGNMCGIATMATFAYL